MNDIEERFLGCLDLEFLFEEGHGKRLAVSPEATPHYARYFTSSQTDPGGLLQVVRALRKCKVHLISLPASSYQQGHGKTLFSLLHHECGQVDCLAASRPQLP